LHAFTKRIFCIVYSPIPCLPNLNPDRHGYGTKRAFFSLIELSIWCHEDFFVEGVFKQKRNFQCAFDDNLSVTHVFIKNIFRAAEKTPLSPSLPTVLWGGGGSSGSFQSKAVSLVMAFKTWGLGLRHYQTCKQANNIMFYVVIKREFYHYNYYTIALSRYHYVSVLSWQSYPC
jgi:hypothetical protein